MTTTEKTFAELVWETLSDTDISDHVMELPSSGKRPPIKYLPWHKAWMLVKRKFPAAVYHHAPDLHHLTETVEVEVEVSIWDNKHQDHVQSSARLAVMDSRFNAVLSPNARDINDARQRCLVKALAFAGLGLNLWGGSDIPVGKLDDPINAKQVGILQNLLKKSGVKEDLYLEWLGVASLDELPRESYPKAKLQLEGKIK